MLCGLSIAAMVVLAGVVVFWPRSGCEKRPLQCGVAGGLGVSELLAGLGLLVFIWISGQVAHKYRKLAARRPDQLFSSTVDWPPKYTLKTEDVDGVIETIAPSFERPRGLGSLLGSVSLLTQPLQSVPPQLIVGQAGEGKTTLLVELTQQVAAKRLIPVPVSLRDGRRVSRLPRARAQELRADGGRTSRLR